MPRPHVSGYFRIRNFFFPNTATVHTHLANSTANPERNKSALQSEKNKSATNPMTCGRVNPDIFKLVRRHSSKFQANCALFDTSMKFGTSIAVTNTSIFRYSAKLDVHWFPWKQQFIKIHEFPLFIPQCISKYFHFNASHVFTKFDLVKDMARCP